MGFVNHGMVKYTKPWLSREHNFSMKQKKFLTCDSDGIFWEVIVLYLRQPLIRAVTNIAEKQYTFYGSPQVYFKDFVHWYRTTLLSVNFFAGIFQEFCW